MAHYDDGVESVETIATDAGDYTLTWRYDTDSESPLRDDDGMAFYITNGRNVMADTMDAPRTDASDALTHWIGEHGSHDDDAIMRRYAKWRAITGSPWQLFTGTGTGNVQGHWWRWLVLVDGTGYTDPAEAARATMDNYESWARGDVYGYTLTDPAGDVVESVWGYVGDDGKRAAREDNVDPAIAADVADRRKQASLAGAGFIGVI